jgi:phosphatidylserine/phosphatidylglycerophosphate/cardiolipin synthase-like enzyme
MAKRKRTDRSSSMAKRPRNDLNAKFSHRVRALRRRPASFDQVSNVSVLFDGIEAHLVQLIQNPSVHYVLVSAPWCSSPAILRALATKAGVGILTQPTKLSAVRRAAYAALTPLGSGMDRVRGLRMGRGRQKSILHQKALVFLDERRVPIGAATGSFNLSGANGSSTNIENMLVLNDARVARTMADEWERVYAIARCEFA